MNTIELIQSFDIETLFNKICSKSTNTIAQVLVCMEPIKAPIILQKLPLDVQCSVIKDISEMKEINSQELEKMGTLLTEQSSSKNYNNNLVIDGISTVIEILNLTDKDIFRNIIRKLEIIQPELAENILRQMLILEDIVMLDKKYLPILFSNFENHELSLALRPLDRAIQNYCLGHMPKWRAFLIKLDMLKSGRVSKETIEGMQWKIKKFIFDLKENMDMKIDTTETRFMEKLEKLKILGEDILKLVEKERIYVESIVNIDTDKISIEMAKEIIKKADGYIELANYLEEISLSIQNTLEKMEGIDSYGKN